MVEPFAPLRAATHDSQGMRRPSNKTAAGTRLAPPPTSHPVLGKPSTIWTYRNEAAEIIGYVFRFEKPDGKEFRPLTPTADGNDPQWRWKTWAIPRPLYGLDSLAARRSAPVLVTEGEKACEAARKLLPNHVIVTAPNGAKSADKADWSPLRGRAVTVWPDADAAGLEYARSVAKSALAAGAMSVAIAAPPPNKVAGFDADDALNDGWTVDQASAFLDMAPTFPDDNHQSAPPPRDRPPTQKNAVISLTDVAELWHDENRIAYVTIPVKTRHEHWPARSRNFKLWLAGRHYHTTGMALGGQALEDGLRIVEARAVNDGPQHQTFLRTGRVGSKIYLDLCDEGWRAVEVDSSGWRLCASPPIKFLRTPAMRSLPEPEEGSLVEDLRQFINVHSDRDFMMVTAWLVAALRDAGPYPIMVVNGEQGSGKSVFSRILRSLVDPSAAPIRAVPKDDRDLIVSASNSWMLAFDNLSAVPNWLSDALCRLASGGGFATRMLHTDRDEMIFEAQRPILINGIPALTDRADLADRALTVHLRSIPDAERRPEDELWADFTAHQPRILGALLDAVSSAIRHLPGIRLERASRMADFEKWIIAASPGLGWNADDFARSYRENRRDLSDSAFEADPVSVAVRDLLGSLSEGKWEGTPTELLSALSGKVSDAVRRSRMWPMTPQSLGNRLARSAPLLKAKGFVIDRRHSGNRTITILSPAESII
jgi:putative DNA primase/helicase